MDQKVEHKNYGDTLDHIEESMLKRIKGREDTGDADDVIQTMTQTCCIQTPVCLN